MGVKRMIDTSIWQEPEIIENFSPEDKLFWLYLLLNQYNSICGVARISPKTIAYELGYSLDVARVLIERFVKVYKKIDYDYETNEVLIINWYKFNWNSSHLLKPNIRKNMENIKNESFYGYIANLVEEIYEKNTEINRVSIGYRYHTNTNTIYNTNTLGFTILEEKGLSRKEKPFKKPDELQEKIDGIIDYLNVKAGSKYKSSTKEYQRLIKALLKDYQLEDFKTVIDKKCDEWIGTKWESYLRPKTLFTPSNFDGYLNQKINKKDNLGLNEWSELLNGK